jgi:hypothetical protein
MTTGSKSARNLNKAAGRRRRPSVRAGREPRTVRESGIAALTGTLARICADHDGPGTVLQIDFMRSNAGPACVLRVQSGPREWRKVAEGPWHQGYLDAILGRSVVEVMFRAQWSTTLRALPVLAGETVTMPGAAAPR